MAGAVGHHGSPFSTAERVHVNRERLDRRVVEATRPSGHHAAPPVPETVDDGVLFGAIKPDLVSQIRRAEIALALAVVAVTRRAVVEEELEIGLRSIAVPVRLG